MKTRPQVSPYMLSLTRKQCMQDQRGNVQSGNDMGWVGSRGPLAHRDLWVRLWCSWQLLGDSVSVQ